MSHAARPATRNRPGRVPTLVGVLALFAVVVLVIVLLVTGGQRRISGTAEAQQANLPPTESWTTLRNQAAGLQYQIPPQLWTPETDNGTDGPVSLRNGARRTAYQCGNPSQLYVRGELGSGTAPAAGAAQVATALAYTAASQYYATGAKGPQITVGQPASTTRRTPGGRTVTGAVVQAIASQSADPCLASRGEVLILVLQLGNADAVLMVNGDVAGGPANPAPATADELTRILDSATPISG